MEIWDLYDAGRRIIGEHVRGEPLPGGGYHLVVHVWIRSGEGRYLIAQRAASRPTYPLQWECPGGSALKGESSLEAALREVREEVGVELDPARGQVVCTKVRGVEDGRQFNDILDVWLFRWDGEIDLSRATTDEVEALLADGRMVDTLREWFPRVRDRKTI